MASPPAEQPDDVNDVDSPAGFKSDEPSPMSGGATEADEVLGQGNKRKAGTMSDDVIVVDDEEELVRLKKMMKKSKKSPQKKSMKQGGLMGFFKKA